MMLFSVLLFLACNVCVRGEEDASSMASSFSGMLEGVESEILELAKKTAKPPETFRQNLEAFVTAIDWRERWIQGLLAFHVVLWLLFVAFRRRHNFQCFLFFVVVGLVSASERLNTFCRSRWRQFSTQNYFDEHGVFAAALFSGPLLALGFAMMFHFIFSSANLLVQVKRKELGVDAKKKKKAE